jgi:hypothetical protein
MSGPEFFQTRMGQKFFCHDIPNLIEAVTKLATAIENQNEKQTLGHIEYEHPIKDELYDADNILKYASEDELFSVFHKFKEYWNKMYSPNVFEPSDGQIGVIIEQLKQTYK